MSSSSSSVAAATDKDKVDGAVIFLHGLGDRGESWAPISRQFNAAFFGGKRIVWVFPTAPVVPVSCNGGARGTSWFDLWSIPVDENAREDKEGFERSVKGLVDTIEELQRKHGLPSAKIFIGGFSQGAALALLTALKYPKPLAGAAIISGWAALRDEYPSLIKQHGSTNQIQKLPIFWGHGTYDNVVLYSLAQDNAKTLSAAPLSLTGLKFHGYPTQHGTTGAEMGELGRHIRRCLVDD